MHVKLLLIMKIQKYRILHTISEAINFKEIFRLRILSLVPKSVRQ